MIYNLFSKETKKLVPRSSMSSMNPISLNKNIDKDYKKAFPYDYNEELYFVYEGSLSKTYKVLDDYSIYFYTDRELVEMGEKSLGEGEKLEGDNIISIISPGMYYEWDYASLEWEYNAVLEGEARIKELSSLEKERETIEKEMFYLQSAITARDTQEETTLTAAHLDADLKVAVEKHSEICYQIAILEEENSAI